MKETRHFIGAKSTREDAFHAISTPQGLQHWWASTAQGKVEQGETLSLIFSGLTTLHFRYDVIVPNEKLILTCFDSFKSWDGTQLVFDLEEKEGQLFITLTHRNINPDDMESLTYFSSKWTIYLLSLKQFLETGKGTPYPTESKLYHGD